MSFTTHTVRDLNQVIDLLPFKPKHPFDRNTLIYQNAGVKDLITFGITERHGISANLDFLTLQQWINQLYNSINSEPKSPLVWEIYQAIQKMDHLPTRS